MRSALVNTITQLVENVVIADPVNDPVPDGFVFVGLEDGQRVDIGWVWNGATLVPANPPALPTLDELKRAKLADLAAIRWQKETGGTVFNGMPVATDAVSQTKYIGAVVGAQIEPDSVINWKMADGTFVPLDVAAITAVAMAVRAHVQACFDNEAELKTRIEAATTVEEIAAVNIGTGWP